jgi:hypothetical protein
LLGVATYRGDATTFVAAWYWIDGVGGRAGHSLLAVYERAAGGYQERFRIQSTAGDRWEQLRSLAGKLPGFVLESSESISDHDATTVIALVDGKFAVVFDGVTSEVVDLNADGYLEILESSWPDGDGFPATTRVHVWGGRQYVAAGTVPWRDRYGARSLRHASK